MPPGHLTGRHLNDFSPCTINDKPLLTLTFAVNCCYQMYKELKLKANHNTVGDMVMVAGVVIKCTKS